MNILSKILNSVKQYQYSVFLALCIGLISFISYNLGRIDALEKSPIKIDEGSMWNVDGSKTKAEIFQASDNIPRSTFNPPKFLDTRVVVSKASTSKRYHYTWCPGAKKIKEENKIWFNSAQEAESRGYALAGNCNQ